MFTIPFKARSVAILILALGSASALGEVRGSYFAVIVSDIEASAQWYAATFDLTMQSRSDEADRFSIVNLSKPGMFVELLQVAGAVPRPTGEGLFKAGLLVDDLATFVAGLPPTLETPEIVSDQRNHLLLVQLRDPDGNVIQVMQVMETLAD